MALDIAAVFDAVRDHCARTGWFDTVVGHEPKTAPGKGLHASVMLGQIAPDPRQSGLASTTGRVVLRVRLLIDMLRDPLDDIELDLATATSDVIGAISADLTLGGLVRNVDLLGIAATRLGGEPGYISQDGRLYRAMEVIVPMTVNDLWAQEVA